MLTMYLVGASFKAFAPPSYQMEVAVLPSLTYTDNAQDVPVCHEFIARQQQLPLLDQAESK